MTHISCDEKHVDLPWWQKGVIYQIYPRSFKDANGDGIGDLAGVTSRLDYVQRLGVDGIWISPIFPSPMADFGYDVSDYTGIDPMFGTMADFDELLAQAHARGLKIILDFVPCHTSDQHPWFLASRSSRANPQRDWYIWADAKPDGSPPNNWLSVFGGIAWEWDEQTGQYYLHSFLKEQPDLNWRNPAVRQAMHDALRFWLDKGVDGFRIDVVFGMIKDEQLRDNPLASKEAVRHFKDTGAYASQEHIYDRNRPEVHDVIREFRDLFDSYGERVTIGETHFSDLREVAKYYGTRGDELHIPFNFTLLYLPWEARLFREAVQAFEEVLPASAWPNYVLGTHDDHRLASRFGLEQARVAAMLLLTLRGTPTLYYGDEIGMVDVDIPLEEQQDPWGKQVQGLGLGRDAGRTPMQWDDTRYAGFSTGLAAPWLPLAPDYRAVNVAAQERDAHSMLNLYRRLLAVRREAPALHRGSYRALLNVPEDCFVYLREYEGQRALIALNFSAQERRLSLPELGRGQVWVSTQLDREGPVNPRARVCQGVELSALTLRGHEGLLVGLEK